MLIDAHCHLHDREFFTEKQAEEMIKRADKAGVKKIICIGTSHEDSLAAREFALAHKNVYWTYGVHPEGATSLSRSGARPAGPSPRAAGANPRAAALRNPPSRDINDAPLRIFHSRRRISFAALLVNVTARIFDGFTPCAIKFAIL